MVLIALIPSIFKSRHEHLLVRLTRIYSLEKNTHVQYLPRHLCPSRAEIGQRKVLVGHESRFGADGEVDNLWLRLLVEM